MSPVAWHSLGLKVIKNTPQSSRRLDLQGARLYGPPAAAIRTIPVRDINTRVANFSGTVMTNTSARICRQRDGTGRRIAQSADGLQDALRICRPSVAFSFACAKQ